MALRSRRISSRQIAGLLVAGGVEGSLECVKVRYVVESHRRAAPLAFEEVHPGVRIERSTPSLTSATELDRTVPTVGTPSERQGLVLDRRFHHLRVPDRHDGAFIRDSVSGAELLPPLEPEAPEDEVQAHDDEGNAPQHEERRPTRRDDAGFPEESEATPHNAERHEEAIGGREPHRRIG